MNEVKTIEEWKIELQTKNYIFDGMKEFNLYANGKKLTKAEYLDAINRFLSNNIVTMDKKEAKKTLVRKKDLINGKEIDNVE